MGMSSTGGVSVPERRGIASCQTASSHWTSWYSRCSSHAAQVRIGALRSVLLRSFVFRNLAQYDERVPPACTVRVLSNQTTSFMSAQ